MAGQGAQMSAPSAKPLFRAISGQAGGGRMLGETVLRRLFREQGANLAQGVLI